MNASQWAHLVSIGLATVAAGLSFLGYAKAAGVVAIAIGGVNGVAAYLSTIGHGSSSST